MSGLLKKDFAIVNWKKTFVRVNEQYSKAIHKLAICEITGSRVYIRFT